MGAGPEVSDKAVFAKTGRRWKEWCSELDAAGASAWPHRRIARHLLDAYGLEPWWSQTVAVAYERARGVRDRHEMPDGYQVQRERTVDQPVDAAWRAWTDPLLRHRWLPDSANVSVRSERADRYDIRLDWTDGRSRVLIGFRAKGGDRSTVGVQHSKLPDRAAAEVMKTYWTERLEALKALLADL